MVKGSAVILLFCQQATTALLASHVTSDEW